MGWGNDTPTFKRYEMQIRKLRAENERLGEWINAYKAEQESIIADHMARAERAEAQVRAVEAALRERSVVVPCALNGYEVPVSMIAGSWIAIALTAVTGEDD